MPVDKDIAAHQLFMLSHSWMTETCQAPLSNHQAKNNIIIVDDSNEVVRSTGKIYEIKFDKGVIHSLVVELPSGDLGTVKWISNGRLESVPTRAPYFPNRAARRFAREKTKAANPA